MLRDAIVNPFYAKAAPWNRFESQPATSPGESFELGWNSSAHDNSGQCGLVLPTQEDRAERYLGGRPYRNATFPLSISCLLTVTHTFSRTRPGPAASWPSSVLPSEISILTSPVAVQSTAST